MANEALNALTAQIVGQSFQDKLSEKRRAKRLQELTESYRSLGFGDQAGAIATTVAAGAPLSASEKEDILAAGHRSEIRSGLPFDVSGLGLRPGQEQNLAFQVAKVKVGSAVADERTQQLLEIYQAGRAVSKDRNLLEFTPGQDATKTKLQADALMASIELFGNKGYGQDMINKLLTDKFDPAAPKKYGKPIEIWDLLGDINEAGYTSSDDILNRMPNGLVELVRLKMGLGVTTNEQLDAVLGQPPGIEHMYGMATKAIESEFDVLRGDDMLAALAFQQWVEPDIVDPDNPDKMINPLKSFNPILFDFLEKFYNKDGTLKFEKVIERAEELREILDLKNKFKNIGPQQTNTMVEIIAHLAGKSEEDLDPDVTVETLMKDYGYSEVIAETMMEMVGKIKSGALEVKPRKPFKPSTLTGGGD